MITKLPLDAMHLCYKGIMARLINFWISKKQFLNLKQKKLINDKLKNMSKAQPVEFGRTIRTFEDVNYFKASELRTIALYSGIIVFKKILPFPYYRNFLMFSLALRIFSHVELQRHVDIGEKLARLFVEDCIDLIGPEFCSFNVHVFIHLASECRKHGPCNEFSCFLFESFLYSVKLLIHSPKNPIVQIFNRVQESLNTFNIADVKKSNECKNGLSNCIGHNRYSTLNYNGYFLNSSAGDSWIILKDKSIVCCNFFEKQDDEIIICGNDIANQTSLFNEPFDSKLIDIYKCKKDDVADVITKYSINNFQQKLFVYEGKNSFSFLPLSVH
jgi:hypothetical protein